MRTISNPETFRNNLSKNLYKKMIEVYKYPIKESIAVNLEKGIYNNSLEIATKKNIVKKWDNSLFVTLYVVKYKSIYYNITNILIEKIINKSIKPHMIAFMTHQELQPEKWEKLLEAKKIKDENRYTPKIEASTNDFTCRRCKSDRCWHYQLQTRSADEPMTTYVTCLDCSLKWKC